MIPNAHSYQRTLELLALLKILALGQQQVAAGKLVPLDDAVARVKARHRDSE